MIWSKESFKYLYGLFYLIIYDILLSIYDIHLWYIVYVFLGVK